MIGAGLSYYNATGVENYLLGNGKIYDGAFDYDTVASWSSLLKTTPFSFNVAVYIDPASGNNNLIFTQGDLQNGINAVGFYCRQNNTGSSRRALTFQMFGGGGALAIESTGAIPTGYNMFGLTYDGSGLASGVKMYVEGVQVTTATYANTLGTISAGALVLFNNNAFSAPFRGKARQLEIINRVATAGEMLAAASSGSFQGAAVANADYLLAVEFNKTGTVNPTTRASTPSYTITAVGGAAYTQYLL